MDLRTYSVAIPGGTLARGFWLYVWEVSAPGDQKLLYVGRTGDSSSPNAQSPFNRMGQHLGFLETSSMLRNHLDKRGVIVEDCTFRLVARGPLMEEVDDMEAHKVRRDVIGALEKKLADDLGESGYEVMNQVHCRRPLDTAMYAKVHAAFAVEFPRL